MQKMWQNLQKWSISLLNVPSKILNILFHLPKDIFCIDSRRIFKHMKILEDCCLLMVKSSKKKCHHREIRKKNTTNHIRKIAQLLHMIPEQTASKCCSSYYPADSKNLHCKILYGP